MRGGWIGANFLHQSHRPAFGMGGSRQNRWGRAASGQSAPQYRVVSGYPLCVGESCKWPKANICPCRLLGSPEGEALWQFFFFCQSFFSSVEEEKNADAISPWLAEESRFRLSIRRNQPGVISFFLEKAYRVADRTKILLFLQHFSSVAKKNACKKKQQGAGSAP